MRDNLTELRDGFSTAIGAMNARMDGSKSPTDILAEHLSHLCE